MNTNEQTIGVKELHANLKKIYSAVDKGGSFLVMKNTRPAFRIVPVQQKINKKYNINDVMHLQFKGGKNLSKNIDELIYSV